MATAHDTPENRQYIQKHRLWLIGEMLTSRIITERPADPIAFILQVLEENKEKTPDAADTPSQDVAAEARQYLVDHDIVGVIEAWLRQTLEARPEHPMDFALQHFHGVQERARSNK